MYITTVAVSVTIAATSLTLVATQRADRRLQLNILQENQSWWCAQAGLEQAFLYTAQVSDWRQRVAGSTLIPSFPVGRGTCSVQVFDDTDAAIADDDSERARVLAVGTYSGATRRVEAAVLPIPHPALSYAAFGTGTADMDFRGGSSVRAGIRSHGRIRRIGDSAGAAGAWFETMSGYAIDPSLQPQRYVTAAIPAPTVPLATYLAMATPITGTVGSQCQLKGFNLTPASNPLGSPNAGGMYALDAGGRDVVLEDVHVRGTLIIHNASGRSVTLQRSFWIETGPLGYPVLLVNNPGGTMSIAPTTAAVTEATTQLVLVVSGANTVVATGIDFNEDGDRFDSFSTSLRGLVWCGGSRVEVKNGPWSFQGCVINGNILFDAMQVNADPQIQTSLSPGFIGSGVRLVAGSVRDVR